MVTCGECKMFVPELFLCPTADMIVRAETDARKCKMGVPKCGDCRIFVPKLFNCVHALMGGDAVGMQVRADSRACDRLSVSTTSRSASPSRPAC
jgi:hypothetical protein